MQEPAPERIDMTAPLLESDYTKKARRDFMMLGFAMLLFIGTASMVQIAVQFVLQSATPAIVEEPWFLWVLSVLPLYLIGLPLALLCFSRVPAEKPEKKRIPFYYWLGVLTVSMFVMYVGNLIGTVVTSFLSLFRESPIVPAISELLSDSSLLWSVPVTVIVAPVMEELICRKMLIDRTRRYGGLTAAFFSAAAFGLIHGNFTQFFYAFGLGFVFAWVYLKTGKVVYTMLLHATINLLGGVIGPWILKSTDIGDLALDDMTAMTQFMEEGGIFKMLPLVYYSMAVISLAVVGMVLLIVYRKSVTFAPAAEPIARGKGFSAVYLNVGVILFVLFCLGLFVYSVVK